MAFGKTKGTVFIRTQSACAIAAEIKTTIKLRLKSGKNLSHTE